jgi:WD40 repeat protein
MSRKHKVIHVTIDGKDSTVQKISNDCVQIENPHMSRTFKPHTPGNDDFLLASGSEYVVTSGLTDKSIKFWKISSLKETTEEIPSPEYEWKHAKKLTALKWIDFKLDGKNISGILYSDKFGEVRFFNSDNVGKEETKEDGTNEEKENNANLLFGHQESIQHMDMTDDKKFIFTVDDKKIKVSHFPEVVTIHSVTFHQLKKVSCFGNIGNSHFYVYSDEERVLKIYRINENDSELVTELDKDKFTEVAGEVINANDQIMIDK